MQLDMADAAAKLSAQEEPRRFKGAAPFLSCKGIEVTAAPGFPPAPPQLCCETPPLGSKQSCAVDQSSQGATKTR